MGGNSDPAKTFEQRIDRQLSPLRSRCTEL
jgi:hypothetical protein